MKKFICSLLASVISMSVFFGVSVSAAAWQYTVIAEPVKQNYTYASSIINDLYISNGNATCTSTVTGKSTVTKIEATQYLEKKILWWWKEVDHWVGTSYTKTLYMNNSKDNLDDGTYRVRTVATVYSGSNSESVEKISNEVTLT